MAEPAAPKISIIVPMYRVEEFLAECIESVLDQSCQLWELILVDDGSPDMSGEIADEYASRDPRIKVIHQENRGVSSARNAGLSEAVGEFVTFIDGDDSISPEYLDTMLSFADANTDYVISLKAAKSPCAIGNPIAQSWDKDRALSELIYAEIPMGCWNKLYRRTLIQNGNLRFLEQYRMGEGLNFITMAAKLAGGRIVATPWSGYHYRRTNGNSATSTLTSKKMQNALEAIDQVRLDQSPFSRSTETALAYQVARTAFSGLVASRKERDGEKARDFRDRLTSLSILTLSLAKVPLVRRFEVLFCRILPNTASRLRIVQHRLRAR